MPDPRKISAFLEDFAHEAFLRPLIERLCRESAIRYEITVVSGRGGHGRVLQEVKLFSARLLADDIDLPDIIVIGIDSNCSGYTKARRDIISLLPGEISNRTVIACPDPHIEKWFFADQAAFEAVIGPFPNIKSNKCQRDYYKAALSGAVLKAGYPRTYGGAEFAETIVRDLDFYRASKNESSLAHFIRDLRAHLV